MSLPVILSRTVLGLLVISVLSLTCGRAQAPQGRPSQPNRVLVLVIRPQGFQPARVTLPASRIFFSVHNRTGLHETALQLDREAGDRLKTVPLMKSKLAWRETVDLTPGVYVLSVQGRPQWTCRITITP